MSREGVPSKFIFAFHEKQKFSKNRQFFGKFSFFTKIFDVANICAKILSFAEIFVFKGNRKNLYF